MSNYDRKASHVVGTGTSVSAATLLAASGGSGNGVVSFTPAATGEWYGEAGAAAASQQAEGETLPQPDGMGTGGGSTDTPFTCSVCKGYRCEYGFKFPECDECYPAPPMPTCNAHKDRLSANMFLAECPCMNVTIKPGIAAQGGKFDLTFGFWLDASYTLVCEDCCDCQEHHPSPWVTTVKREITKTCDVDEVTHLTPQGLSARVTGEVTVPASGPILSTRFNDARVVGHVSNCQDFPYTGAVTIASIGLNAPGPFHGSNWLVRAGLGCTNAFTVETQSDLEEGSVRVETHGPESHQDDLLLGQSPGAPMADGRTSIDTAPPKDSKGSRTFWLGAAHGGGLGSLDYSLLLVDGGCCLSTNLVVEGVMVRLPTNAYCAAFGTARLRVDLDPASHDPEGYAVSVDGTAACSGQPPFDVDTSALAPGEHALAVACNTFPDMIGKATLTVVKVDSILPSCNVDLLEVDDGDNDSRTRIYVVPIAQQLEYPVEEVLVKATLSPAFPESSIPANWTLQGGIGAAKLARSVCRTMTSGVSKTILSFTFDGVDSGFTTTVYVYDARLILLADAGAQNAPDVGHSWGGYSLDEHARALLGANLRKYLTEIGFWPTVHLNPSCQGKILMGDDAGGGHPVTGSKEYRISFSALKTALTEMDEQCQAPPWYSLIDFNCTDFAIWMGEIAGVSSMSPAGTTTPWVFSSWLNQH